MSINRNLSINYDEINQSVTFRKMVFTGLLITGIGFTLTPFLFKNAFDRESKTLLLTTGLVASLTVNLMPKNELLTKLKKVYEKTQVDQLKNQLTHEIAHQETLLEIENKQALAQHIEHEIPDYQLAYWAKKLGIESLISKFYIDIDTEETFEKTEDNQIFTNNSQPLKPTIHTEKSADLEWLYKIVNEFTLPQGKRLHEHCHIMGVTQSGKSTLTNVLITLIIDSYKRQNIDVILSIIDPKFPKTTWCYNPTFTGYEQVLEGINQASKELQSRKKLCKQAVKDGQRQPDFKPYLIVLDELDTAYGKGKGYSNIIDKNDAISLIHQVSAIICEGAAYEVRIILVGQSPQSQVNGINTSLAKQLTRFVLGTEGLAFLESPFFPVKGQSSKLIQIIEPLLADEKRCAVIVSNKGKSYALEVPHISLKSPQDSAQPPKTDKPIEKLKAWYAECFETNSTYPDRIEIGEAWKIITGESLDDMSLGLLIAKMKNL